MQQVMVVSVCGWWCRGVNDGGVGGGGVCGWCGWWWRRCVGVSSAHDQVGIHESFQKCELSSLMKVTQWSMLLPLSD